MDKSTSPYLMTAGRFNVAMMNELRIDYTTIGNLMRDGLAKNEARLSYEQAIFNLLTKSLKDRETA